MCEFGIQPVSDENTYATEKVILEVELEVGVLLDGLEDLRVSLALFESDLTTWYTL